MDFLFFLFLAPKKTPYFLANGRKKLKSFMEILLPYLEIKNLTYQKESDNTRNVLRLAETSEGLSMHGRILMNHYDYSFHLSDGIELTTVGKEILSLSFSGPEGFHVALAYLSREEVQHCLRDSLEFQKVTRRTLSSHALFYREATSFEKCEFCERNSHSWSSRFFLFHFRTLSKQKGEMTPHSLFLVELYTDLLNLIFEINSFQNEQELRLSATWDTFIQKR